MPCPFYGRAAAPLLKTLLPTHGNQCALITGAHAPCKMETAGQHPDLGACEFNGSARAEEFAQFADGAAIQLNGYPD